MSVRMDLPVQLNHQNNKPALYSATSAALEALRKEHLTCPVCKNLFQDPHQLGECGHLACEQCAVEWISQFGRCFCCELPVHLKNMNRSLKMGSIVAVLWASEKNECASAVKQGKKEAKKENVKREKVDSVSCTQVLNAPKKEEPQFSSPLATLFANQLLQRKQTVTYLGQNATVTSKGMLRDGIEGQVFDCPSKWASFIHEMLKGKAKFVNGWKNVMLNGCPLEQLLEQCEGISIQRALPKAELKDAKVANSNTKDVDLTNSIPKGANYTNCIAKATYSTNSITKDAKSTNSIAKTTYSTSSTPKSNKKPISTVSHPQIVFTGLTDSHKQILKDILTSTPQLPPFNQSKEVDSKTTHIVTSITTTNSNEAFCTRTLKYLEGLLNANCHIVSFEWLLESISEGHWLQESTQFLIQGDSAEQSKLPLERPPALFGKVVFCLDFYRNSKAPPSKNDLFRLVAAGRGNVQVIGARKKVALPEGTTVEVINWNSQPVIVLSDEEQLVSPLHNSISVSFLLKCISKQALLTRESRG